MTTVSTWTANIGCVTISRAAVRWKSSTGCGKAVRGMPERTEIRRRSTMGNAQVVGNAGLYYCCYKLSLLGWNVMPTARNARGIDIIAYGPDAKSFCGIQVKTVSKRDAIPLGDSLERMMGDYWIVVNQMASGSPSAYVLMPDEVRGLAHRNE